MSERFREGEALSASKLNGLANALTGGGPRAGFWAFAGQDVLALTQGLTAKITGGSGPYSWTEAVYVTGTGWVDGPRSGSSNAYEVNSNFVSVGKRVRLYPNPVRGWDFQFNRKGSSESDLIQTACCPNGLSRTLYAHSIDTTPGVPRPIMHWSANPGIWFSEPFSLSGGNNNGRARFYCAANQGWVYEVSSNFGASWNASYFIGGDCEQQTFYFGLPGGTIIWTVNSTP